MKYFFPDSQDQVDPNFDFISESHLIHRIRQRDDHYAHEALGNPPFDGILLSLAIIDGVSNSGHYNSSARIRLRREGINNFFRINQGGPTISTLGDCGAFAYVKHDIPPFSVNQVLDFNESCGISTGLSPDHIPFGFGRSDDQVTSILTSDMERRLEITLENANEFLSKHRTGNYTFTPGAVAHGWSAESYAESFLKLQKIGYKFIAIGGLVPLKTKDICSILDEIRKIKDASVNLHLLGISRIDAMQSFEDLGVNSLDSTSPFFQAFKDATNNFHFKDKTYSAVRVPQVHGNTKLRKLISSGDIDQQEAERLEKSCLKLLREFDSGNASLGSVIQAITEYDLATGITGNRLERITQTLSEKPWKNCNCSLCRKLGIEIIIFRGSERNKSRGFHNLHNLRQRMVQQKLTT
jgi:hypothetical protein